MKSLIVLLCLLCANVFVLAQTEFRSHEIVTGYPAPYFGYRYHFSEHWAGRVSLSYEPEVDAMTSFVSRGNRLMPRFGVQRYFTDKKVRPFVLSEAVGGFGYDNGNFDVNYSQNQYVEGVMRSNGIGLGIGAGVETVFWNRLSVAAYLQHLYTHTERTIISSSVDVVSTKRSYENNFMWDWKVSIGYRF